MIVLDDWLLTPERAAIYLPSATAVVADVHLGYGEARRDRGEAVPLADVDSALAGLTSVIKRHNVHRLVVAGDLFEAGARSDLIAELLAWKGLVSIDLALVPGNHDRGLDKLAMALPIHPEGVTVGRWRILHGDGPLPDEALVQGHEHPWARWGPRLSGPCYLVSNRHLVLPAYSRDAAGVNVLGNRRWGAFRCCVIAGERVLDFGTVNSLRT